MVATVLFRSVNAVTASFWCTVIGHVRDQIQAPLGIDDAMRVDVVVLGPLALGGVMARCSVWIEQLAREWTAELVRLAFAVDATSPADVLVLGPRVHAVAISVCARWPEIEAMWWARNRKFEIL